MKTILETLKQAEIHAAQARELVQAAHSASCAEGGLAELVTLDLIGVARALEDRIARVGEAMKTESAP